MIAFSLHPVLAKTTALLAMILIVASMQPSSAQTRPKSAAPAPAVTAPAPTATPAGPAAPATDTTVQDELRPPPKPMLPKVAFPNFWDPKSRPHKPTTDIGTIRFLTSGDFPPFGFLDSGGRLTGYHVDLARALCTELAATCTIQMRPFDDLVAALAEKRGDAIVAGLRVTSEMRTRLETSDAYLTTPGRFVMREGTTLEATPEGLADRWISVVSGSAHERFVLEQFPKSRVAAYPDETAARDALREGAVEAHFGDAIALSFWLDGASARRCCVFRDGPWLESRYFGEGLRIAVAKGNSRLRRALDYGLQRLAEDGKLAELYLRWFPRGYY
jgi:polar amino acid transport system substrate-binding protein